MSRGMSDDEFRCPVCHYLFPKAQKDHVQRCVRREMAQDPRIQRRLRTSAPQQQQNRRRAATEVSNNSGTGSTAAAGGSGAGAKQPPVPPITLKGKTAAAAKARPKSTSIPAPPAATTASKQQAAATTASTAAKKPVVAAAPEPKTGPNPIINVGQGGLVITHPNAVGKSRSSTVATANVSAEKKAELGIPSISAVASASDASKAKAKSAAPPKIALSKSASAATSSKAKSDKKKINASMDNKTDSSTKATTPREIKSAVADSQKIPARVYSGMKQNQGTFWTFIISVETTAVDLMDLVSAKCGIPVEVMALYSSTEKNAETRIKDDENVYKIKLEWQTANSTNKFLLKERLPGDVLVRKPVITAPVAVSAVPSAKAPPPPPPPTANKTVLQQHQQQPAAEEPQPEPESEWNQEEQEYQEQEEEEHGGEEDEQNEQDDQILCPVFSGLKWLPPGTNWNCVIGQSITTLELLVYIATKANTTVDKIAAFAVSPTGATERVLDDAILATLILGWKGRRLQLWVKDRPAGEEVNVDHIDVNAVDVGEIDEQTLLKEQWECKKEKLVVRLDAFLKQRPSSQQLYSSGIIKVPFHQ
eukprot:TRINITY_DN964_c0_g4_i1.p1 TRINITY_DN964_c0_g4~~TRINITY_DN964_c0_g4_i1.p1  ORF type:complete len:591 (-),score=184.15 TRINITY_DN964_c0_g4_i1:113-1885(-)